MTRRERLEKQHEQRLNWAERATERGEQHRAAAHEIAERRPAGQPTLRDHHSASRSRRDSDRLEQQARKGISELELAAHHDAKANGLARQLAESIFSDDPDAISALGVKIAELEALQERMKRANVLARGGDRAGLATLGYSEDQIEQIFHPDYAERAGFPSYVLTNNAAEIRRLKARLEALSKQHAGESGAMPHSSVLIEGDEQVRLTFATEPGIELCRALSAAGFRWKKGAWVGYRDDIPDEVLTWKGDAPC